MARRKTLVTYLIAYFFTIGTAFRYLSMARNEPDRWTATAQWTIAGLFVAFFVLLVIEPWLSRRSRQHTHLYLVVQAVIGCHVYQGISYPKRAITSPAWCFHSSMSISISDCNFSGGRSNASESASYTRRGKSAAEGGRQPNWHFRSIDWAQKAWLNQFRSSRVVRIP